MVNRLNISTSSAGSANAGTALHRETNTGDARALRLIAGEPRRSIHLRDLAGFVWRLAVPSAAATVATSAVLTVVFGWENTWLILGFALPCITGWLAMVSCFGVVLSLATVPRPEHIAHRLPQVVRFDFVALLLKVTALALALAVLPALVVTATSAKEKARVLGKVAPLAAQVSLTLNFAPDQVTSDQVSQRLASLVAREDQAGRVAFAGILNAGDPQLQQAGFDGIVVMNSKYLTLMAIDSERLHAVPDNVATTLSSPVSGIFRDGRHGVAENGFKAFRLGGGEELVARIAGGGAGGVTAVSAPLLLVTERMHNSLSVRSILSLTTTENITFSDPDSLARHVASEGLGRYVGGIQRVTDGELQYAQFLTRSAATMVLAAGVLGAALLISAGASARIYAIRHARRLFVYRSNGRSWPDVLRRRMIAEFAMVAVVGAIVTCVVRMVSGTWSFIPAMGVALYALASSWLHLRAADRVFVNAAKRVH